MTTTATTYIISNQDGDERGPFRGKRGPFRGKHRTKAEACLWQEECGQSINVCVAETGECVAILWPDEGWLYPDRHDEEGNRIERKEW